MLELSVTPQFKKDILKIPSAVKIQADFTTTLLRENPSDKTLNTKKLVGIKPSVWRVRIGSYRLIYSFNKTALILLRIRHRKDVYKNI